MRTETYTRVVLDADERETRKTWGADWPRMKKDEKKRGGFGILTGTWHGPQGSRIVHVEYVPIEHVKKIGLRQVIFTDGTVMGVSVEITGIVGVLARKVRKKLGYKTLIDEARGSMVDVFKVAGAPDVEVVMKTNAPAPAATTGDGIKKPEATTAASDDEGREEWWMK